MTKHISIVSLFALAMISLVVPFSVSAQGAESNDPVQITLRLLAPVPGNSERLPEDLAGISDQLRRTFNSRDLTVVETYIAQISAARGSIDYNTVASFATEERARPTFLNWELRGVEKYPGETDATGFIVKTFKFQARYPVTMELPNTPLAQTPFRYEQIGFSLDRMSVVSGKPTVIGSMLLPNFSGKAFLVLTVSGAGSVR
jgi:hypothetical protein